MDLSATNVSSRPWTLKPSVDQDDVQMAGVYFVECASYLSTERMEEQLLEILTGIALLAGASVSVPVVQQLVKLDMKTSQSPKGSVLSIHFWSLSSGTKISKTCEFLYDKFLFNFFLQSLQYV